MACVRYADIRAVGDGDLIAVRELKRTACNSRIVYAAIPRRSESALAENGVPRSGGLQAELGSNDGERVALDIRARVTLVDGGAQLSHLGVMPRLPAFEHRHTDANHVFDAPGPASRNLRLGLAEELVWQFNLTHGRFLGTFGDSDRKVAREQQPGPTGEAVPEPQAVHPSVQLHDSKWTSR